MNPNDGRFRPPWQAWWRSPVRALLLGGLGAVAAGLFTALGGAILCLTDNMPWDFAAAWGLRGVLGGIVAGALIGALSGWYHVEERSPKPKKAADPDRTPPPEAHCNLQPTPCGLHQNGRPSARRLIP